MMLEDRDEGMDKGAGIPARVLDTLDLPTNYWTLLMVFTIHDLLPFADEHRGLEPREIQSALEALGYRMPPHTLKRYLKIASELFWMDIDQFKGKTGTGYWKRLNQGRLCDQVRQRLKPVPEWSSDIKLP